MTVISCVQFINAFPALGNDNGESRLKPPANTVIVSKYALTEKHFTVS